MEIKYFDNAATTPVKQEVFEEMVPYLTLEYGNPSSIYSLGRSAKRAMEEARKRVASLLHASPKEIYFTSCGSESDNMALKGIAYAKKAQGNHIITSKIEHPAILNTCETLSRHGFEITYLDVNSDGFVNLETLENSITDKTILISVMFANNEIGTIQPIQEISRIAKKYGVLFHTDAVQAAGNIDINVEALGIDMLSLSGHKIYAPKGIGALYMRKGIEIERFLDGGHQENNKRAGTENIAEIVGLGKACQIAERDLKEYQQKLQRFRDYYVSEIKKRFPCAHINGSMEKRLPGNCHVSFAGINSSDLLLKLDELGICASGGSACSSGNESPSHVLMAIGCPSEFANGALRTTFGDFNTMEEVEFLVESLDEILLKSN